MPATLFGTGKQDLQPDAHTEKGMTFLDELANRFCQSQCLQAGHGIRCRTHPRQNYRLGTKHSLVVHSHDGMDEISISGGTMIWDVTEAALAQPYEVFPYHFGFKQARQDEIRGGMPEENAAALRRIFDGEKGALRNVVVMNAAAALIAGNATEDLKHATQLAEEAIDSGRAGEKLNKLVELSQRLG